MKSKRSIAISHPAFLGNEKKYVNECLDTVWISSVGKFIQQFEQAFARFCSAKHAIAMSNGTTALHAALLALGVQDRDEIITPTLSYVATANAIRYCGALPILVDSEPRTMNLDPELIEQRVSRNTRGIVVVHLYGHPADMEPILDIARRRSLFVVEDAAEAHGALYRGCMVGGLGDAATFSFFGNKILTTGEGGMVTTQNQETERRIRLLRGQGMDPERRYWFPIVGYNYRMTNIQAAIGLAQLEQAYEHMARRRRVSAWYRKHLTPLAGFVQFPTEEKWARHAFWMYTILLASSSPFDRDDFMLMLLEKGIETRPIFYPMHIMPPYREPDGAYPVAEDLAGRGISLPTHALMTEDDVAYIAATIKQLFKRSRSHLVGM